MAEFHVLKEEQRVLKKVKHQLMDQLNRLKVEELALLCQINGDQQETDTHEETSKDENLDCVTSQPLLDLDVMKSEIGKTEEEDDEEESSDDEMDNRRNVEDDLTLFVKRLEANQKSGKNG